MLILDRLYDGTLKIGDRPVRGDSEYLRLSASCQKQYAAFAKTLPPEQGERLDELHETYSELYAAEDRSSFFCVFRVAARMLIDAICDENDSAEK